MWPCLASLDKVKHTIICVFHSCLITFYKLVPLFELFQNLSFLHAFICFSHQCCTVSIQMVTLGDMKPDPVLWHEDTRKKPWENGRYVAPYN